MLVKSYLDPPSPNQVVPNKYNYSNYQQKVDESTANVGNQTQEPKDYQNGDYYHYHRPDSCLITHQCALEKRNLQWYLSQAGRKGGIINQKVTAKNAQSRFGASNN